jgi:hypothetical protein
MHRVAFAAALALLQGVASAAVPAAAPAVRPSFEGVWQIARPVTMLKTSDGKTPPLQPAARKLYEERIALMKAGKSREYDATTLCKPMGDPRTGYEGQPFDIVQNDQVIFVGYTWNRMARFIYLREKHGEILGPSYYGSWVGQWDGNSLVFDGVGFHEATLLDAAGMPHSDDLHVVQRLALKDGGKQLEVRTTFEDGRTFTHPWTSVHTYRRLPGALIEEDICPQRLKLTIY